MSVKHVCGFILSFIALSACIIELYLMALPPAFNTTSSVQTTTQQQRSISFTEKKKTLPNKQALVHKHGNFPKRKNVHNRGYYSKHKRPSMKKYKKEPVKRYKTTIKSGGKEGNIIAEGIERDNENSNIDSKLNYLRENIQVETVNKNSNSTQSTTTSVHGVMKKYPVRNATKPVFFFHLHKSMGTTLCMLASINGMRAAGVAGDKKWGFNCNIKGDDPGHLGLDVVGQESSYGQAEGEKFGCEERSKFMFQHKLTFSAIERWIFPQEICPERFVYMTCLRDPLNRIKSSVKFHPKQTEGLVMQWATQDVFMKHSPISTGSTSVDNFYVRSFAGKNVFLKSLGALDENDLQTAENVLNQFQIVLILEQFSQHSTQLKKILGWTILDIPAEKRSTGRKCFFTKKQENELKKVNYLDYRFYARAREVANERMKALPVRWPWK